MPVTKKPYFDNHPLSFRHLSRKYALDMKTISRKTSVLMGKFCLKRQTILKPIPSIGIRAILGCASRTQSVISVHGAQHVNVHGA